MKIDEIDALLKKSLPTKRYEHSVNVMYEAVILAERFHLNEKKVRVAALLHDCGREVPVQEAAEVAREMGIKVDSVQEASPILLHASIGKVLAQKKYGVEDEEILRAIELHTTGGKDMTSLEMAVFLADMIEPGRTQKNVNKLRQLVCKNLELAMLETIKSNMFFLMQNNRGIHPRCIECWNWLINERLEEINQ